MLNDKNLTDAINSLHLASIIADFRIVDGKLVGRMNLQYEQDRKDDGGAIVRGTVVTGSIEQLEDQLRALARKQRKASLEAARQRRDELQREIEELEKRDGKEPA